MGRGTDTLFRDLLFGLVGVFVALVMIALPFINDPGKEQDATARPVGNIMVYASWPDRADADVDLWMQAPFDQPVGWSAHTGRFVNFLRDDVGIEMDPTPSNFEMISSRGIPPGEWTVNLHLYSVGTYPVPIPVSVEAFKYYPNGDRKLLFKRQVKLLFPRQELTVMRWEMDENGEPVPGSNHGAFKRLFKPGEAQ